MTRKEDYDAVSRDEVKGQPPFRTLHVFLMTSLVNP